MTRVRLPYIFLLLLFSAFAGFSQRNNQHNDDKLAMQYYEQKEYDKANLYFDGMFERSPEAMYSYYFKSLLAVKDYSKAEKITKKQLKANRQNVFYYVYLGKVYKLQGDEKKENPIAKK